MKRIKRVVIAAGGTGGHIYPGLALAYAFLDLCPDVEVHFWGARGGMETRIVPQSGFKLKTVSIGRLNSNVSKTERSMTFFLLPLAIFKALLFLMSYRPQVVVGVGGHASGPLLLASSLLGISNGIWEPNAIPGLTNRWLSRWVQKSLVVFEAASSHLNTSKIYFVGIPVREEIENIKPTKHRGFHILILGGSQGSALINKVICEAFQEKGSWLDEVSIVHQTGISNFKDLKETYPSHMDVEVHPYLDDMGHRYGWADLVICRSGAGTLAELAASGTPSILVPLATAADNHQQKNAQVLEKAGAAVVILESEFNGDNLKKVIIELKNHPEKRKKMSESARRLHKPRAAKDIVELLCK